MPENILEFDKIYPDAKICKLEQNYRCSSTIVDAAAAVVANNLRRADKTLRTENPKGELIDFRYETDAEFEGWWVATQIKDEVKDFAYEDIAIFYRTNSQSRLLEDALRREQIPYQIYGTVRFYDRAEIKDVMAYLRLLINPRDDVSLLRVLNTPSRGLGDSAEEAIMKAARERDISLLEATRQLACEGVPRLSGKLSVFVDIMESIKLRAAGVPLERVVEEVAEATGYFAYLHKKFPELASEKEDNVMELASAAAEFSLANPGSTIGDWLQAVTLASDVDGDEKGVTMMTLHMAKGLEFERVYLTGVEDGLLPHFNSLDDKKMIEEERRLFYVGMTRAKKKLSLTAAYMRRTWGNTVSNDVSRFLTEIPPRFVKILTPQGALPNAHQESFIDKGHDKSKKSEPEGEYYDYHDDSDDSSALLEPGSPVSHPTYGHGTVEEIQMNWGKPKIVVRFKDFGLRRVDAHHLDAAGSADF